MPDLGRLQQWQRAQVSIWRIGCDHGDEAGRPENVSLLAPPLRAPAPP